MSLTVYAQKTFTFLISRFKEPMGYVAIMKMISAGSWHALDGNSKGEVIMQAAIFLVGLIEFIAPSHWLYKPGERAKETDHG